MATLIERWEAADGKTFETQRDAEAHDAHRVGFSFASMLRRTATFMEDAIDAEDAPAMVKHIDDLLAHIGQPDVAEMVSYYRARRDEAAEARRKAEQETAPPTPVHFVDPEASPVDVPPNVTIQQFAPTGTKDPAPLVTWHTRPQGADIPHTGHIWASDETHVWAVYSSGYPGQFKLSNKVRWWAVREGDEGLRAVDKEPRPSPPSLVGLPADLNTL